MRRIMRAFKINEISAVDRPAQSRARMVILKRDSGGDISAAAEELSASNDRFSKMFRALTEEPRAQIFRKASPPGTVFR